MEKEKYNESVNEFLKMVDKEIGQWGIYKNSPELRGKVKKNITDGLLKLPELTQTALIPKLLQSKIFIQSEIDKAFKIPIEERKEIKLSEIKNTKLSPENLLMGRGIMPENGYMVISSSEKKGKTLFALNMGLCLVSGNYFLDIPIMKKCRVFYIFSESNVYMLKDTITKILKGLAEKGIKIEDKDLGNFLFYNAKVSKLILTQKNRGIPDLKKSIERFEPDVVIIDPIGRIVDYTLNNAENIVTLVNLMNDIRGCFWVLVHHSRKRASEDIEKITDPISRIRGSSNLANFAESIICIEPAGNKMPDNYKKIYFSVRRAYEPIPLQAKWDIENLNYELMDTTDFKRPKKISIDDLIAFINDNFEGTGYRRDIVIAGSQKFKVSERYIYKLMIEAFNKGKLIKTGDKWEVKEKQVDLF
ncbi:hypothetical protein ES702_07501 [subsurface metagenome]